MENYRYSSLYDGRERNNGRNSSYIAGNRPNLLDSAKLVVEIPVNWATSG